MSDKMKPILILPPDTMSDEDIKKLDGNGICCVVAKNPAAVHFVDPMPAVSSRSEIERAALVLSRRVMAAANNDTHYAYTWKDIFVQALISGTALDKNGSAQEQQQRYFDEAKLSELRRLAQEEAREERKQAREAKKAATQAKQ